ADLEVRVAVGEVVGLQVRHWAVVTALALPHTRRGLDQLSGAGRSLVLHRHCSTAREEVEQRELHPLGWLREQRRDAVVERGELRIAVDGIGRLAVGPHPDTSNHT